MSEARVPNHDWARYVAESTSDTIHRVLAAKKLVPPTLTDEATLHDAVREVVAVEMEKVAHRYNSRSGLVAPNNVAYDLTQRASTMRSWKPEWWMVVLYHNGDTDEYPVVGGGWGDAELERRQLVTMPGVKEAKVEVR